MLAQTPAVRGLLATLAACAAASALGVCAQRGVLRLRGGGGGGGGVCDPINGCHCVLGVRGRWEEQQGGGMRLLGHRGGVTRLLVARGAGRELLVSGDGEGRIIVWDTEDFTQIAHLRGHKLGIASLALRGADELFSGGYDNHIWHWSLVSMQGHRAAAGVPEVSWDANPQTNPNAFVTWPGHTAPVLSLALAGQEGMGGQGAGGGGADGVLLSGDMHGVIKKWRVSQEGGLGGGGCGGAGDEAECSWQAHLGQVWALAVDHRRRLLFSAGEDWLIAAWVLPSCNPSRQIRAHTAPVRALRVVGEVLFSGGRDCVLRAHALDTGHDLGLNLSHTGWVLDVCETADLRTLVPPT